MPLKNVILEETETYVRLLCKLLPAHLYFHSLNHTEEVVNAVNEIGSAEGLDQERLTILAIAAWFHDTGYCFAYKGHEEKSKELAWEFLSGKNYDPGNIELVLKYISATLYPQQPKSLEEKIICDADFYHFSCRDYVEHEKKLRKEWKFYLGKVYTDEEWLQENCHMLQQHIYFTDYGKKVLQPKKETNLRRIGCLNCPDSRSMKSC